MRGYIWIFWLLVFVGPPIFAGQVLYTAIKSPHPVAMSCADYLHNHPGDVWLDLSQCDIDYGRAIRIYHKDSGEQPTDDNYAPVVGDLSDPVVHLFLKLPSDESEGLNAFPDHPTPEQRIALEAKFGPLSTHRTIKGLVQVGLDADDKIRGAISSSGISVASDWDIIEQKDPTPVWVAFVMLLIPASAGGYFYWSSRRRRVAAAEAQANALRNLKVPEPPH